MSALETALTEWRSALGEEHVITEPEALASAETATFATTQRIPAILRPSTTAEVQACLRIAQARRVPVYPVSGGRNWGYGSRVPPRDGCVLIELARMNRILAYDEKLAYLTIEPGVTFRQAYTWLKERNSPLFITTIGGSPEGSLIGNALERGDGRGPHADIFNYVCGLEVVLPNGERIETGMARFPSAHAAPVFRWGLGPSLDGLFSQSALGVVTRMTFWLVKKAPYLHEFAYAVKEDAHLWELLDRLQPLALDGTLRNSLFIWNDVKALSIARQFPFEHTGGRTPLPSFMLEQLREELGRWIISGAISAQDEELGALLQRRVGTAMEGLGHRLEMQDRGPDYESAFQGRPSDGNLAMTYWRKKNPVPDPPHPDRDKCGFIWCSVAVPFTGEEAQAASAIATRVPRMFALEPNVALLALSPRCMYLVVALAFDREVPGEDERAMACYQALQRELIQAGYYPMRLGLPGFPEEIPVQDDSRTLLKRLKEAVDPAGIFAPGRYGF
ncbi:FAD-binding oxidoreductase [Hyalangium minutum]|uniref:Glycolate oxidase subunit protein n=1 Tax=Hyalangium minutum TaxID=394096 RepID=A0A085WV27_9BACT|nr:FAD-binding oxidoreductase [Hyalangium minutum]KFE71540.1 Glycolate oxidase subunit protein [Hyalangium minutum]